MAETKPKSKGLAIAAMCCGIGGLVLCWIPILSWLAFIADILGIVFGAVALSKIKKGEADGKGMAVTGIVCGAVGIVGGVVVLVIAAIAAATILNAAGSAINAAGSAASSVVDDYNSSSYSTNYDDYDWSWLDED
ncbi:DUF4190 domain-containing protein [Candidatus Saccharibacteria bacterium]|nr:DUF4190 domain-containing protein [Candidatus Saccharibacteria bacterium]